MVFLKAEGVQHMRLFIFILISFLSYHSSNALAQTALAQTVTDGQYLNSRIAQAKPLSFDELKRLFTLSPTFSTDCVIDDTIEVAPDPTASAAFRHITSVPFNGGFAFEIIPGKHGFNILVERRAHNPTLKNTSPYHFRAPVSCGLSEDSAHCGSLSFTHAQKLPPTEVDGEIAEDGIEMTESWSIHFGADDVVYAKASVELLTKQRNWIGAPTGVVSLTQNYVCQLNLDQAL